MIFTSYLVPMLVMLSDLEAFGTILGIREFFLCKNDPVIINRVPVKILLRLPGIPCYGVWFLTGDHIMILYFQEKWGSKLLSFISTLPSLDRNNLDSGGNALF